MDLSADFIRETLILNVHTLEWSTLSLPGFPGMYNFSSCVTDEGDLYIFGGTEEPLNQSKKLWRIREVTSSQSSTGESAKNA